jgi:hypothetical protein
MNPTELALFDSKEQTLLVATERTRLVEMTEDELDDLFALVRRARTKYTKLYRRQSAANVAASSSRAGTASSNQRTKRKAEIFEDALARVARALAAAARRTATELKQERLAAARAAKGSPVRSTGDDDRSGSPARGDSSATGAPTGRSTTKGRQASRTASGARNQARRDAR